jgi:hypothetical protein
LSKPLVGPENICQACHVWAELSAGPSLSYFLWANKNDGNVSG